jgi:uncharacterized protein YceH (UPF0502 family)
VSDNKTQLATFRIEPELWEAFKVQARKNGRTASDVLTDFVQTYVESASALTSTESTQLDKLDLRIDEKIAPIKAELAELRARLGEFAA